MTTNPNGLLEGDYKGSRRIAIFTNMDDSNAKEKALQHVIHEWLKRVKK